MNILITGTSKGIGKALASYFINKGHFVYGIDILDSCIDNDNYEHFNLDIRSNNLPDLEDLDIIINNAGLQNSEDDIDNNLKGTINVTEKYINSPNLKSILFNASASSITGSEFSLYCASKAGIVGYMKNVAIKLASRKITVNALSLGGVLTESNDCVINDEELFKKIMDVTPMKKWMDLDEVCEWVYFLTIINKSMTGENILVDNGEAKLNQHFIWKD